MNLAKLRVFASHLSVTKYLATFSNPRRSVSQTLFLMAIWDEVKTFFVLKKLTCNILNVIILVAVQTSREICNEI